MAKTNPLHIFKPGRHTAMGGQTLAFTEADLAATCKAYDPALHEAPLVVGHPSHDLPAYGWVQSLQFSEGGIDATPAQVNTDFADMVAAGAFKKISAAFYEPNASQNPVPGVYYLRHVGFLGAQPPAIKGLRNAAFADGEAGVVTFSEWDDVANASLWRSMREWLIGKFGQAEADNVIPGYRVADLEQSARDDLREAQAETATPSPLFSETPLKESAVTEAEAALLRTQNAELQARTQALEASAKAQADAAKAAQVHAANVAFCEGIPANKLIPAWRDVAVATLDHFAAAPQTLEFGEGDARAPLVDGFKAMLAALPAQVEFGEVATTGRVGQSIDKTDANAIATAATAYQTTAQAEGRDLSHAQAVAHVVGG